MMKSPVLNVVDGIFRKVGKFLLRDYFELEDLQSSSKGNAKFVENSRTRVIENLMREFSRKKDDYSIKVPKINNPMQTEFFHKASGDFSFIINPIEGIYNFERANPFFAIVLAVEDMRDNSIISSYIHSPALGSSHFSEKGQGSWVESVFDASTRARRLRVSQNNTSSSFLSLQDFLDNDNLATENLRIIGSSAIAACMLASGKAEKMHFKNFDYASFSAGKLLINEAGGKVEDADDFVGYNSRS
jgi:myo-inositol-1(or 4)-monophosphatase